MLLPDSIEPGNMRDSRWCGEACRIAARQARSREMELSKILNGRLPQRDGRWTIQIDNGRINSIDAARAEVAAKSQGELDVAGGLLTPHLVDPHLHLDLAYSRDIVEPNRSGTPLEAIQLWSEAKKRIQPYDVREHALRAIDEELRFGTGMIRTHIDVASASEMRRCEVVLHAAHH